jgi:hypothetical protein
MIPRICRFSLLLVPVIIYLPATAGLGQVDDVGLKSARELSAAIDRAQDRFESMSVDLNYNMQSYLNTLDNIRASVRNDVGELLENANLDAEQRLNQIHESLDEALDRVEFLEKQAVYDLRTLLWEATCIPEVFADTVKRALGEAVDIVNASKAKLKLSFGRFTVSKVEIEFQEIEISSPDETYEKIKATYETKLARMDENTSVRFIIGSYANIARLARLTSCHFKGLSQDSVLLGDFVVYSNRARTWAIASGIEEVTP